MVTVTEIDETKKKEILKYLVMYNDLYEVATALRGFDIEDDYIKWLFTARIRALLNPSSSSIAGVFIRRSKYIDDTIPFTGKGSLDVQMFNTNILSSLAELRERNELRAFRHYISHVTSALHVISSLHMGEKDELETLISLAVIFPKYVEVEENDTWNNTWYMNRINIYLDSLKKPKGDRT